MIGINRTPLKKPMITGNLMFLNLLYKKAVTPPTHAPPKTLVDNDWIPILELKILPNSEGVKLYQRKL
jgi:hypothetical protein